jgi:hypothetical protein
MRRDVFEPGHKVGSSGWPLSGQAWGAAGLVLLSNLQKRMGWHLAEGITQESVRPS